MARQKSNTKPALDKNMLVPVANFTTGTLVYVNNRNGMHWRWVGFGTTDKMELGELITMKSSQPKFLNVPWLVILDDEVVEYLGLTKLYENIVKPDEFDRIYNLPNDKLEALITNAPIGMKQVIAIKAKEKMATGEFDSMSKKLLLERVLNIKFNDE